MVLDRHRYEYAVLHMLQHWKVPSFPRPLGHGLVPTASSGDGNHDASGKTRAPLLALVMSYIPHPPLIARDSAARQRLLPGVRRALEAPLLALHALGYTHNDLAMRNVLVDGGPSDDDDRNENKPVRAWLVDAEAVVPREVMAEDADKSPRQCVLETIHWWCFDEGLISPSLPLLIPASSDRYDRRLKKTCNFSPGSGRPPNPR